MKVASRFAIGVHILSLIGIDPENENNSEWLAGSIGVNPVIVRNVTGMLRRAGLVTTRQGIAGVHLAKPLAAITLRDVYQAVHAVEENALFGIHENPNPDCLVGANIQAALESTFTEAQQAMEFRLAQTSMAQIVNDLHHADALNRQNESAQLNVL